MQHIQEQLRFINRMLHIARAERCDPSVIDDIARDRRRLLAKLRLYELGEYLRE